MKKWEYSTYEISDDDDEIQELNALGQKGWELVRTDDLGNGSGFILKREITDLPAQAGPPVIGLCKNCGQPIYDQPECARGQIVSPLPHHSYGVKTPLAPDEG